MGWGNGARWNPNLTGFCEDFACGPERPPRDQLADVRPERYQVGQPATRCRITMGAGYAGGNAASTIVEPTWFQPPWLASFPESSVTRRRTAR